MKHSFKRVLSFVLVLAMVLSLAPAGFAAGPAIEPPAGKYKISQTDYTIVSGVTESQVILNDTTGNNQQMAFITTVAPNAEVTFRASYYGYYTEGSTPGSRAEAVKNNALTWGMMRTTDQAAAFEQATGGSVVFATNGDYYNMQTAQPLGYLIMEGNLVQTGNGNAKEPYFAVLKDGSYVIRDYGEDHSDVLEAISGPFYLVKDGVNVADPNNLDLMPRNSIGVKADGSVMTMLIDGRQPPYSVGMSLYDMGEILLKAGCVDALYLDGGGSATYASVREGTDELAVRNSPSDGPERTVASALLLVSTAVSDGSFDHASISPNNRVYTPGSSVQFTAIGVDAAGGNAELPTGLSWNVNAEAGNIDSEGLFTAKAGFVGEAVVELKNGAKTVGTTKIVIADIDDLYFTGESISLDFNADSDLGLNAKYAKRGINYKDGDFTWTIESKTEGIENEAVGSMNGNIFHSGNFEGTVEAAVTVSYTKLDGTVLSDTIAVEIGKMPIIYQDFEPDENGPLTAAHFHMGKNTYHYAGSPYGDGYYGDYPQLDVITAGTYSGNPTVTTLTAPYQFTGNYDSAVPAAPIFRANGYTYYLWPNNSIKAYMAGGLRTASREDGAPVRSGDYSLELNYDYSSFDNSSNSNFYVRYCGEEIPVEGYPTELGVWIYAPEGTPAYKPYVDVAVWNGNGYSTKNLPLMNATDGANSGGINWTGWMYCYTDLTSLHSSISAEHPMMIRQGEGLLWLSYQPAAGEGRFNGTLYFDDMRFVYGTNLDDLVNPVIDSVTINGEELAADGSTVLTTSDVELAATFHDPESQNRTGVDASATVIFIDGKNIPCDGDDSKALTRTSLGNGVHTVTVQISDGDGNYVSVNRQFEIKAEDSSNAFVSFGGDGIVTLGGNYVMELTANGMINEVEMTVIDINTDFGTPTTGVGGSVYGAPVITFAEGVEGSYEFLSTGYKKGSLSLKASKTDGMEGVIATVSFAVPATVDPEVDYLKYRVSNISFTDAEGKIGTDAYAFTTLPVTAYYTLDIGIMVQGRSCTITVYDVDGNAAPNVNVYRGETLLGTTGEDGTLTTDGLAGLAAGESFTLTASSELGLSFATTGTVLSYAGKDNELPTAIFLSVPEDPSTEQTISWFANAQYAREKAYVRYMEKAVYDSMKRGTGPDSDYLTKRAESKLVAFPTTKDAAVVNSLTLSGLTPDTEYCFWVGDGSEFGWSEMQSFTTQPADSLNTRFYVLGDTQMLGDPAQDAEAIALLQGMLELIDKEDVDFGLQSGDFVDNGGSYGHWEELFEVFNASSVADTGVIHVLGNHEYYGDFSGSVANAVLELPHPDYFSYEFNNVYVAVINNSANLTEAMEWLKVDAAETECKWKVLSVHQSVYYTNPSGGNQRFHEAIPSVCDEVGIDVVFSGHDHSYARTEQLKAGEPVENGTTYMICGDLGEKSRDVNYAAVDDPNFHFAAITQEYDAVYIIADATEHVLTVTAYNADGTVLDTFTKDETPKPDDPDDGDDGDDDGDDDNTDVENHNIVYDRENDLLFCDIEGCEYEVPAEYTGPAVDKESGKDMYFIGGEYVTDWFQLGNQTFHFDLETGEAHELTVLFDIPTTCDERGRKSVECECGETRYIEYEKPAGHSNEMKTDEEGNTYYECIRCGAVSPYDLTFIDVPADAWFAEAVNFVVTHDLFNGKSQMIFGPNDSMTRAQLVTVLWRFAGSPEHENVHSCVFKDCKLNSWYTAAVNWAYKNEIVNGVGENLFAPEQEISRQQIVTILYRYAMKDQVQADASADLSKFEDGNQVSSWAEDAMKWAVGAGLIQGDAKMRIKPLDTATRAQVATMMMRFYKLYQPETPVEPETPVTPENPGDDSGLGDNELPLDPVAP
ncbi:MAG: phosphodiester glycosidase family protein [Oscillospiraceae bacterium]|nr:phosphodiester glycosidase family protein [Oscillospiraceae bacterium]